MAVTIIKFDEIQSAAHLVEKIGKNTGTEKVLFRGQNVDKPLLPKIARLAEDSPELDPAELEVIERSMLDRFKKESIPHMNGVEPKSDWEWMAIAQHQGLPTRLLDWSANALAALWFAVASDPPEKTESGSLWTLKVKPVNLKSPGKTTDLFSLRRTYVFQPPHIDKRIAAQAGWFSVHKYAESSGSFVPLDRNKSYKNVLSLYQIPVECFPKIRAELRQLGITQATMFPDLAGLCSDIAAEFLGHLDDAEHI